MILDDFWRFLENTVFAVPSTETLFNQYNQADLMFDKSDAVSIRRDNLKNYLSSFTQRPAILLVGEAPGPKGCRFSGVPFTSEHQLLSNSLPFKGRQSSKRLKPYKEASATIFWGAMRGFECRAFVWNSVPFHPHAKDKPMSIRPPSTAEIQQYIHVLRGVVEALKPRQVVSIGGRAARALRDLGVSAEPVRHPSRGGAGDFRSGMAEAFSRST
jgi:uracil-DNA glycosylase